MAELKNKFRNEALLAGTIASVAGWLLCGCEAMLSSPAIHSPKDYTVTTPLPSRPALVPAPAMQTQPQEPAPKKPPEQPPVQPVVIVSNPVAPPVTVYPAPSKPIE